MTGMEKLDFVALRQELREGFLAVRVELQELGHRVQSLETTRGEEAAVARERQRVASEAIQIKGDRRLSRNQAAALFAAISGAAYGAIRLAHDLRLV